MTDDRGVFLLFPRHSVDGAPLSFSPLSKRIRIYSIPIFRQLFHLTEFEKGCVTSGEDEDCVTSAECVFIGGNFNGSPARISFKDNTKRSIKMSHSLFTPIFFFDSIIRPLFVLYKDHLFYE